MSPTDDEPRAGRRTGLLLGSVLGVTALLVMAGGREASAAFQVFQNDLAGFNLAAGSPGIAINFDSIVAGTNIANTTINGVTFSSPDSNTLPVVVGTSTSTPATFSPGGDTDNKLFPTSGDNVLSPGGASLVAGPDLGQKDSLLMTFDNPLSAFGLDVLFQSLDGFSFASYEVRDASNNVIASGGLNISAAGNGSDNTEAANKGAPWFMGFVSDSASIKSVLISEGDDNNEFPDANLGYDTLRFVTQEVSVPEPGTLALFGAGALAIGFMRRRKTR